MAALDFVEAVSQRVEEVLIGGDDGAVHVEMNDGLGLADRRELSLGVGLAHLAFGDIGCELDDLEWFAVAPLDRVVARLDPNFFAALADPLVFGGLIFPALQSVPELLVGRALPVLFRHEHAVMAALDFLEEIAHRLEEVVIGSDDCAVHLELDHRLGMVQCVDRCLQFGRFGRKHRFSLREQGKKQTIVIGKNLNAAEELLPVVDVCGWPQSRVRKTPSLKFANV